MLLILMNCWKTYEVNCGSLSEMTCSGMPNRAMIDRNFSVVASAVVLVISTISGHLV
jgi:hypothetical protein